ncbi:hypothetical protein [Shewanella sp.]|uniref:hypothetical protein n=1 Tax=Shewanella sp. TaxID=50422 RepID=UPI0026077D58|nr:hypothetical protein [Shewanella sp.]
MKLTLEDLTQEDHNTVLAYVTAKHLANGYKGPCFIFLPRLAELHLVNSIVCAELAIDIMRASV